MPRTTLVGKQAERQGGAQWNLAEVKTLLTCPVTGRRIYRKAFDFGALADTGDADVAHGISTIDLTGDAWFRISGHVTTGTVMTDLSLTTSVTAVYVDDTNITITSGADLTGSTAMVVLEYCKTST